MLKNILSLIAVAAAVVSATTDVGSLVKVARADAASEVVMADANLSGHGISASFKFLPAADDTGLQIIISASGLNQSTQYPFHIHTNVVPSDGNCTGTGGHLDPFGIKKAAGANYKCDKTKPQSTCELGDLAGYLGNIAAGANGEYTASYPDSILTFTGGNAILGHSIVIHGPDSSRLACANITGYVLSGGAGNSKDQEEEDNSTHSGASSVSIAGALAVLAAAIAL
ncbi:Superoxide dismutase [Coemansia interrupta]|uniref:Superoxide dismutase n=1 Tax=Coemansia interrupta TaxID=1126814 RepID=A0A9W8LMN2_9FUNG|nr:Superoxide dismutase [Coemansia interrupta]